MVDFSLWDIVRNLLLAARWTIGLSLIAFIGGGLVGMVLVVVRMGKLPGAAALVSAYVQLFQGVPLLVQLFLAYYGLGLFGINTSPWVAAGMGLTLYTSAFLAEIWRGCIASIPRGQWEASESLALSFYEQLRYVILPQAVRIAVPPTVGFFGAGNQGHCAGLGDRIHGTDQSGQNHCQPHRLRMPKKMAHAMPSVISMLAPTHNIKRMRRWCSNCAEVAGDRSEATSMDTS
jgi:His/Glu/Gln/Arg/opine family amino acid ABC transporter permease subunit